MEDIIVDSFVFVCMGMICLSPIIIIVSVTLLLIKQKAKKDADLREPIQAQDPPPIVSKKEPIDNKSAKARNSQVAIVPHSETSGVPMDHLNFIGRWRYRRGLRRQAKIDYQSARGTIHKGQIQACLKNLGSDLNQLRKQEAQDLQKLKGLDKRRQESLRKVLTDHLVRDRLIEVSGIGRKTADRIRRLVFKNRLSDLHRTQQRLRGVGAAKQASISRWVRKIERNLPAMLEGEFPGKTEVIESHRSDERLIQLSLGVVRKDLASLEELKSTGESALETLEWVTDRTFYKRLVGEEQCSLETYTLGIFPPWERPPTWFARLLNEFGG